MVVNSRESPKNIVKIKTLIYLLVVHLGDVNKLKLMEARGANMNSADYDGRTALHVAASQGKIEATG